jgi:hypothetical protein
MAVAARRGADVILCLDYRYTSMAHVNGIRQWRHQFAAESDQPRDTSSLKGCIQASIVPMRPTRIGLTTAVPTVTSAPST